MSGLHQIHHPQLPISNSQASSGTRLEFFDIQSQSSISNLFQKETEKDYLFHSTFEETNERKLGSHDDYVSYLVDRWGNEYNPYSLGWRYLGMYIDCDLDAMYEAENGRRRLEDDVVCARKVLWAAYVDPRYRGGSIGEYQYFNLTTLEWDKQYCRTKRCARMDCHEPKTHFKLVGVFKETDGMEDWAEQLFKHEGICLWNDEDGYEFMQKYRQIWPSYCYQLSLTSDDGETLYLHMKPEPWGNFSYGIYSDEYCSQESEEVSFSDYVQIHYSYYYGYDGYQAAVTWNTTFEYWNEWMEVYKICQPCRAYNLHPDGNTRDYSFDEDNDERQRNLGQSYREMNDGQGAEEQWGYDCYDDAGYRNCNQCFKFETHTDYEPAEVEDLELASAQGTILAIKVDGVTYGEGGYISDPEHPEYIDILIGTMLSLAAIALVVFGVNKYMRKTCPEFSFNDVVLASPFAHIVQKFRKLKITSFPDETIETFKTTSPDAQEHQEEAYKKKMNDELTKGNNEKSNKIYFWHYLWKSNARQKEVTAIQIPDSQLS